MKRATVLCFILIVISSNVYGQKVEVIKYPELLDMMERCDDELVIYNFWATWCAPCIREMPHFNDINNNKGVTVRFISMDDVGKLEGTVIPFLRKKNIDSELYLLDETDFNAFIDKVDKRWSGAIPATIIFDCNEQKKLFYEKEFKEGELQKLVHKLK